MQTAAFQTIEVQEQQPRPAVRVVKGGRYGGLNKARHVFRTFGRVLVCALILGLIVSVVQSQAVITELSGQIEETRRELADEQSEYDYLSTSLSNITSRANVAQIAEGELGLTKADPSQKTYLKLEEESVLTKNTSGAARLLDCIKTAALSLIGTLDP